MIGFTIVIPAYNGGSLLRECVVSALAQTYPNFDVLVLDDGSTDGSVQWLESLNDPRLRLECSRHVGIVANWNRALHLPLGEFMTFIGQDDLLDPDFLHTFAGLIADQPEAALYHARFRFVDANGRTLSSTRPAPARETAAEFLRAHFRGERDTWGAGYVWRSADFQRLGGILPFEHLLFADDALWLALMSRSYKATAKHECFSIRILTHSTGRAARWEWWVAALRAYIPFLQQLAERDADLAQALCEVGPDYFLGQCRAFYLLSLAQETKRFQRTRGETLDALCEALALIAPQKVAELRAFARSRGPRLRLFINRFLPARWTYNLYLLLRYREWHGKPLRPGRSNQ